MYFSCNFGQSRAMMHPVVAIPINSGPHSAFWRWLAAHAKAEPPYYPNAAAPQQDVPVNILKQPHRPIHGTRPGLDGTNQRGSAK